MIVSNIHRTKILKRQHASEEKMVKALRVKLIKYLEKM